MIYIMTLLSINSRISLLTGKSIGTFEEQLGKCFFALIIIGDGDILTATEKGYGKRTAADEFSTQGRGGQGVIAIQTSERNGRLVGATQVTDEDEIMLISSSGTLVRTGVADISTQGRNTQGVRLIRVVDGDRLVGLDRIEQIQGAEDAPDADGNDDSDADSNDDGGDNADNSDE